MCPGPPCSPGPVLSLLPGRWQKSSTKMTERFDCHHCENSLFGRKYVLREEQPYCVGCFEALFASTCEECGKLIGCDCKDLSYKDRHWHEACFHCSRCRSSLVDKPFAAKEDQVLCTDCYSQEYSSRCQECRKAIMPGTRKMEYKGSSWHETCFTCHRCQQPIGTKSFIPKDGQNFCVPCYEKQHALQCIQCKKPITSGGVTYREQPWHRECFVCTACKKPLSGQRFTSRDEFAYCLGCFCDLYAKKCTGCANPISGECPGAPPLPLKVKKVNHCAWILWVSPAWGHQLFCPAAGPHLTASL
uniref:Four and a half LIM domains 2 n=2 Tax=Sus scrofa TaxID=9823 RepID=A0A8D1S324_PIG